MSTPHLQCRGWWWILAAAVALIALTALRAHWQWQDTRVRDARAEAQYQPQVEWTKPKTVEHFSNQDGNYWFDYARRMLEEGEWRVHFTQLDNAPFGREAHWSSSYSWWLVALAWLRSLFVGGPAVESLPWAGDAGGPILHALVVVAFLFALRRKVTTGRLVVGALMLAGLEPVYAAFAFARPDHHGLHAAVVLGMCVCMAVAQGPLKKRREVWVVASAVFGAMGLWIDAMTQFVVLLAMGLGGCVWAKVRPKWRDADEFAGLWRLWGYVGAAMAVFFYVLEYFGRPWPMHLSVNHPLFAFAWAGMGEFVARVQFSVNHRRVDWMGLTLCAIAVLQLPFGIMVLPDTLFPLKDSHVLAALRVGGESVPALQMAAPFAWAFVALAALGVWVLLATGSAWKSARAEAGAVITLVPAIGLLALSAMQVLWVGMAAVTVVAAWVFASVIKDARILNPRWIVIPAAASIVYSLFSLSLGAGEAGYSAKQADWQAVRDIGLYLRSSPELQPRRILTDGANENYALFNDLCGARLVVARFWECADGIRAADRFWLSTDDDLAFGICLSRGITHVLLKATPANVSSRAKASDVPLDKATIQQTLLYRLGGPTIAAPSWLIPVELPATHAITVNEYRMFRVEPSSH